MIIASFRSLFLRGSFFAFLTLPPLFASDFGARDLPESCPICLEEDFEEPVRISCCQNIFCKKCLESCISRGNKLCPMCQQECGLIQEVGSELADKLAEVPVDCIFKEHGCRKSPAKNLLQQHELTCLFRNENFEEQRMSAMEALAAQKAELEQELKAFRQKMLSNENVDAIVKKIYDYSKRQLQVGEPLEANRMAKKAFSMVQSRNCEAKILCCELLAMV